MDISHIFRDEDEEEQRTVISFPLHRVKNMIKADPTMKRKFKKKDLMLITRASVI